MAAENLRIPKDLLVEKDMKTAEELQKQNCPCCATGSYVFPQCELCKGTGVIIEPSLDR